MFSSDYEVHQQHISEHSPFSNVSSRQSRKKFIDTHEALKKEMFDQTGDRNLGEGISDLSGTRVISSLIDVTAGPDGPTTGTLSIPMNIPEEGVNDQYIYFDTDAKDSSSNLATGQIAWSILQINQNKPIDTVIEMQISNFYIPDIPTGAMFPQYFFYKRVNILIEEMQTQAIFAQNNIRFHFDMDVQPAGIANLLSPAANFGKFIFTKPFRDIQLVTFAFRAPIKQLQFPTDIYTFVSVAGSSPARIQTIGDHGITPGDLVSIFSRNFASNVGDVDALINSPDGHLLTSIDATTLEFPAIGVVGFDFAGVGVVQGQLTIGYRRVAFTVRFRSRSNNKTNSIVPV